jgi:hypothetical protein
MLKYYLLILLLSPALSIVAIFGLPYFPNEKIAFLLLAMNFICVKKFVISSNLLILGLTMSLIFTFIIVMRWFQGGNVNVTDVNMITIFFALVFYMSYFRSEFGEIIKALPVVVFLQLLISVFQQICMQIDLSSLATIFNNYPPQADYIYPSTSSGIFRTSGLFNESSQYATFLAFFIIVYYEGLIKKSNFSRLTLTVSILELLINQSITAFLIISMYSLYKLSSAGGRYSLMGLFFIIVISALIIIFPEVVLDKIYLTLVAEDVSHPRLLVAYQAMMKAYNEHFFIGNGLSWDAPTWDFVSVYFSGYGILGLSAVFCLLIFILWRANFSLMMLSIVFLTTNGNLLVSLNIYLLSFIYAQKYNQFYDLFSLRNSPNHNVSIHSPVS